MHLKSLLVMGSLRLRFRNGGTLVQRMRDGKPCGEIVLWNGSRISHPSSRGGLIDVLIEVWLQETYTKGFYRPADGDVIVDAGANVGLFSLKMARQNSKCRIVALEPFEENFEFLEANVKEAGVANIQCTKAALGASEGTATMRPVGDRSLDHVLRAEFGAAGDIAVVPLAGLFELCKSEEIDFLKVDIEGSEHEAFAAAPREALQRIKRIAMEYHDQIVPGTLNLLRRVLQPTHEISVRPSGDGCGMLLATRQGNTSAKAAS
jgi:FkbM family methyltransferase